MDEQYTAEGTLFFTPTMTGQKGLISMDYKEYEGLLATGMMGEEVKLTLKKADTGSEYAQSGAPEFSTKAGLYAITIEGTSVKPQLDIPEGDIQGLLERGFKDGDKVTVIIERLPYHVAREANYDDLNLGYGLYS